MSFAQRLALARACSQHLVPTDWKWEALSKLNKLRNLLAHKLDPTEFVKLKNDYVRFIKDSLNRPLPTPTVSIAAQGANTQAPPLYTDIDMVNAVLFGALPVALGIAAQEVTEISALSGEAPQ